MKLWPRFSRAHFCINQLDLNFQFCWPIPLLTVLACFMNSLSSVWPENMSSTHLQHRDCARMLSIQGFWDKVLNMMRTKCKAGYLEYFRWLCFYLCTALCCSDCDCEHAILFPSACSCVAILSKLWPLACTVLDCWVKLKFKEQMLEPAIIWVESLSYVKKDVSSPWE